MANFGPIKAYILRLIDAMIDQHQLKGPFLDAGCGKGDIARHLARRGWAGQAADSSPEATKVAQQNLTGTGVHVVCSDLMSVRGTFRTVVIATVIEHVANDTELLKHLRTLFDDGKPGHLIISMPNNPQKEWRWDDDFYGHYRRYERDEFVAQLASCGFHVLEYWDYTFPVFWAMRRAYTKLIPVKVPLGKTPEENTRYSAARSSYAWGPLETIVAKIPIWRLVFALQRRFKNGPRGYEVIVLARTT